MLTCQFAFWGCGEVRSLFRDVGIAFCDVGGRSLFGVWEGDRFLEMWEGDRFLGCKGRSQNFKKNDTIKLK
ncbi:MAG: hypothetical protein ACKPA7_22335 [Sphaerospermopsis kisseleviana]